MISLRYILLAAVVIAVVIAAVHVVIPRDKDLFILHRPEVERHRDTTTPIVRDALSIANTRIKLAEALRSRFESNSKFTNVSTETHFSTQLSEIVTASLQVSFDVISVSVNLVNLIQAYIDRYSGGVATYVMIETFSETKASDGQSLYSINVSILTKGARVIGRNPLRKFDLVDQLSNFFIDELVVGSTNCDNYLCASMMPYSELHLNNLAGSFDALGSLAKVGPCEDTETNQQCLDSIRQVLTDIIAAQEGRTVAEFGLFLVELRQLKQLITTAGTTDKLADALEAISAHYSHLTNSTEEGTFFRGFLDSKQKLQDFLKTNGFSDLQLTQEFLSTFTRFLDGREAYRIGDTATALEHYEEVDKAPPWFEDFLDAYRHISRARSAPESTSDVDNALVFLSREDLNLVTFFRTALLAQTIRIKVANDTTVTPELRESLFQRSEEALARAVGNTSMPHDELGAQIEHARSLHAFGRVDEASEEMANIERQISEHIDAPKYRLAAMSAALYFAESGAFEKAKTWLERAAKLEKRNICVFEKAPEFRVMRESDRQGIARWTSGIRQQIQPEC